MLTRDLTFTTRLRAITRGGGRAGEQVLAMGVSAGTACETGRQQVGGQR